MFSLFILQLMYVWSDLHPLTALINKRRVLQICHCRVKSCDDEVMNVLKRRRGPLSSTSHGRLCWSFKRQDLDGRSIWLFLGFFEIESMSSRHIVHYNFMITPLISSNRFYSQRHDPLTLASKSLRLLDSIFFWQFFSVVVHLLASFVQS